MGQDGKTVRAPDIAFTHNDRLSASRSKSFSSVIPDLVAETTSPSDRAGDVTRKTRWWHNEGVKLVWAVEPETHTITSYLSDGSARVFSEQETLTAGDLIPGFEVLVASIFE